MECGYHPHTLIADVNRKVAFKYRAIEEGLPVLDDFMGDEGRAKDAHSVNCQEYWHDIEMWMIFRTFNDQQIRRSTTNTRSGNVIINSEHHKVHRNDWEVDVDC